MSSTLCYRAALGERRIGEYVAGLARWAGSILANAWGARVIGPVHMQAFMFQVQLPTDKFAEAQALQV